MVDGLRVALVNCVGIQALEFQHHCRMGRMASRSFLSNSILRGFGSEKKKGRLCDTSSEAFRYNRWFHYFCAKFEPIEGIAILKK